MNTILLWIIACLFCYCIGMFHYDMNSDDAKGGGVLALLIMLVLATIVITRWIILP